MYAIILMNFDAIKTKSKFEENEKKEMIEVIEENEKETGEEEIRSGFLQVTSGGFKKTSHNSSFLVKLFLFFGKILKRIDIPQPCSFCMVEY